MHRHPFRGAILSIAFLVLCGCGGRTADKRVSISGSATFGGKPIVFGGIDFVPDDTKGHSGPSGIAVIIDGKYDMAQGGEGIFPGPHVVRITAYDSRPPERTNELEPAPVIQALVTNYTVSLDLKASPVDIDIPESAKGKDFSKTSEAKPRRANDP